MKNQTIREIALPFSKADIQETALLFRQVGKSFNQGDYDKVPNLGICRHIRTELGRAILDTWVSKLWDMTRTWKLSAYAYAYKHPAYFCQEEPQSRKNIIKGARARALFCFQVARVLESIAK